MKTGVKINAHIFCNIPEKIPEPYRPKYMLRPWIEPDKLDYGLLSLNENPLISSFLENHLEKVDWRVLCRNPNAIPLLKKHLNKAPYSRWSMINNISRNQNPEIIHLLEEMDMTTILDECDWFSLSGNSGAVPLLQKYPEKIVWFEFCHHNHSPDIISLLEQHFDKINWKYLSANPAAIPLLQKYPEKIDWRWLSSNPSPDVLPLLEKNLEKLEWRNLSENPVAAPLLLKRAQQVHFNLDPVDYFRLCENQNEQVTTIIDTACWVNWLFCGTVEFIDWYALSRNPNAVHLLEKYPNKIVWPMLCLNQSPQILRLLEKYPEKIEWSYFSINPQLIPLLEKHPHLGKNIHWKHLSKNPCIFMTYGEIAQRIAPFREELIQTALHPSRIRRIIQMAGENACFDDIF